MPSTSPVERLKAANEFIHVISSHSHRYFRDKSSGRVAELQIDAAGLVWIRDEYTLQLVNTHLNDEWDGFNHGGNLRHLVKQLRDFIVNGTCLRPGYFALNVPGERNNNHWGYDEHILVVRDEGIRLGVIGAI